MIAFHTKHIMGAVSLKASLPLRVGFIELGRGRGGGCVRKEGLGKFAGARSRSWPPSPAPWPRGWKPAPRRALGGGFPRAERMSAQVRTRLCFQHLGAAAVGAARRTRKSRSSSPPSPRRAAIPPAPTAVAGEVRPAPKSRTRATASPKVSPRRHLHPFRDVA